MHLSAARQTLPRDNVCRSVPAVALTTGTSLNEAKKDLLLLGQRQVGGNLKTQFG